MVKKENLSNEKTLSDWIFQVIGDEIVEGKIEPGEKLREAEIAERLQTSRAPIREALQRLEERGLVIRRPNAGVRVTDISQNDFIELYEIREALEGLSCRLAAKLLSESDLIELRNILKRHEEELVSQTSFKKIMGRDLDFHYTIAFKSKNTRLIKLLCDDYYNSIRLYRTHFNMQPRLKEAVKDHRRIIEALEERDAELAEILMRRHIRASKEEHLKSFKS